ncbi:transposase [Rudanella paleaurantiibacter]|uniref:Transposase n=1 Tax=Rudanella paleaurantiibacter TaxID=2614655 RepID=A0A7J5U7W3_9BACT|nr:transposase [Rudanella paleaurantiibacter]
MSSFITGGSGACIWADDPYDNAYAESLWGRLKAELLKDGVFLSAEDVRTEVLAYIEGYYN